MGFEFNADAIAAAAAMLQKEKQQEQTKNEPKREAKREVHDYGTKPKTQFKSTAKIGNGVGYVIPASFKERIEKYLKGRADMAEKLKRKDKSIEKCCEFIYGTMLNQALKARGSKMGVGMSPADEEVYGLAVHYYDESNEDLQKELKGE